MSGRPIVVTGTGTGIGKTIVTAAIAANHVASGQRVAVFKPAQSGLNEDGGGDIDTVSRLVPNARTVELVRYPEPLAPATAARRSGITPPSLSEMTLAIQQLCQENDLVLVEGAGGLLVEYDDEGTTIADVARATAAPVVVVADPRLGTLNHTRLTLEALAAREIVCIGVVLGSWESTPDLASTTNVADLTRMLSAPIAGAIAAGACALEPGTFAEVAQAGLAPHLGGQFDGAHFLEGLNP